MAPILNAICFALGLWFVLLFTVSTVAAMQCCNVGDDAGTVSRGILALVFLFAAKMLMGA